MKSLMRWEPFTSLRKFDPFDDLLTMQHEMDRLFSRFLGGVKQVEPGALWIPSVESYIKDGKLVFKVELPGVDAKDLDVSVTDRELVIKGERKSEKSGEEEKYSYREIAYGTFERRFALPGGIKDDELKAKYTNGILEITMPAPVVSKMRKIEIEMPKEDIKLPETAEKKAA